MTGEPVELAPRPDETRDVLMRGRVPLIQARKGYRSSVDAMVLAWFAAGQVSAPRRCVDLGTGTGLVAILLGRHFAAMELDLIERQPALAERAQRNLHLNDLSGRARVHLVDIGLQAPPTLPGADLIVCNPPYHLTFGRMLPAQRERREAHYETTADLARFATVAREMATAQARFCLIYPAERAEHALRTLQAAGWSHVERTWLHHRHASEAPIRVLLCGRGGPTPERVECAPVLLHQPDRPDNLYGEAIERFLRSLGPKRWP